jgi:AraC-like DNA-binding protein
MMQVDIRTLDPSAHERTEIRVSHATQVAQAIAFAPVFIKYVLSGSERYQLGGRTYEVSAGEYLVGLGAAAGSVLIDSREPVTGVCIDFGQDTLLGMASALSPEPEGLCGQLASVPVLKLRSSDTRLGRLLQQTAPALARQPLAGQDIGPDLFFALAEQLILDQQQVYAQLKRLPGLQPATNAECYRRLAEARAYIARNCCQPLRIRDMARACALSEYHFIRLFRLAFGQTPYQYLLEQRIAAAEAWLRIGEAPAEVAFRCGFADLPSFSKAFKQRRGLAPSRYGLQNSRI